MINDEFPYYNFYFEIELSGGIKVNAHKISGFGVHYTVKETPNINEQSRTTKSVDKSEYDPITITKGLFYDDHADWKKLRRDAFTDNDTREHLSKLRIPVVFIRLMLTDGTMAMAWTMKDAYPSKWTISDFDANESGIATEAIEFVFNELTLEFEK